MVGGCGNILTVLSPWITELPLIGIAIKDRFLVYTTDIRILMAMLDYGTQAYILQGILFVYEGAIFENLMADFL